MAAMNVLEQGRDGHIRLRVHAQPRARRVGVVGIHGDALKIAVREPATEGKANKAMATFLARLFQVPASAVVLESGGRSRGKRFRIEGVGMDTAKEMLSGLLDDASRDR